jgi:uncharacterized protein (DUF305 family)
MICGLNPASYNRQFLTSMLAHHAAAIPIIKAVAGAGRPEVETVAQTMVDQTIEMRWMATKLPGRSSTVKPVSPR